MERACRQVLVHARVGECEPYELELLSLAIGSEDAEKLARVVDVYDSNESWSLYVYRPMSKTLGVVGCEGLGHRAARIRHIGVDPTVQNTGIGRLLIEATVQELGFRTLSAETDAEAVGFYAACGFGIDSLGEKYPGVERFECTLRAFAQV